jgi:hypothetical protein
LVRLIVLVLLLWYVVARFGSGGSG